MPDRSLDRKAVNARYYRKNKKRIAAQKKKKRKLALSELELAHLREIMQ